MTLTLPISDEAECILKAKAASAGVDVRLARPIRTLEEISGPMAGASGMSEDELSFYKQKNMRCVPNVAKIRLAKPFISSHKSS
jgi:hypothetical protein